MRQTGLWFIVLGFLGGAYVAVQRPEGVVWPIYAVALATGIGGVWMVRRHAHEAAHSESAVGANLGAIENALESIVTIVRTLEEERPPLDVDTLRARIDSDLPPALDRFVQARQSISVRFGLDAYAEVMNPFAAGERAINRVWSAATDGYIDEAHTSLSKALEQFRTAQQVFGQLVDNS